MSKQRDNARVLGGSFEDLLGAPVEIEAAGASGHLPAGIDCLIRGSGHRFACKAAPSGQLAAVTRALFELQQYRGKAIPLLVVPFMGPGGRDRCDTANQAWMDLSGNAEIKVSGLIVHVEGKPNRFRRRGRPWSVFAAKSSRVARRLLQDPDRWYTQREISDSTGLSESFVSKIVRRLETDRLVSRDRESYSVTAHDPGLLLDAWAERYDFFRHAVIRGHASAPSGEALLKKLSAGFRSADLVHAATGLAGAWLLAPMALFRTTTLYVSEEPSEEVKKAIGFRETESGSNVWLVVPDDEGVFQGTMTKSAIPCAAPVQVYLDLKFHPERAEEAAAQLRREVLTW